MTTGHRKVATHAHAVREHVSRDNLGKLKATQLQGLGQNVLLDGSTGTDVNRERGLIVCFHLVGLVLQAQQSGQQVNLRFQLEHPQFLGGRVSS